MFMNAHGVSVHDTLKHGEGKDLTHTHTLRPEKSRRQSFHRLSSGELTWQVKSAFSILKYMLHLQKNCLPCWSTSG